jgi:uncharacterized protein (DUF1800 family)
MLTRLAALSLAVILATAGSAPVAGVATPHDDAAILHVLNRLTYGPRPGDVERVRALGLQTWIDQQLAPDRIDDAVVQTRLSRLETLSLDSETIQREYAGPAMAERRKRQLENPGAAPPEPASRNEPPRREPAGEIQRKARQVVADVEEAKILRAVYSERQLEEVLVDFWFNHFNVFAGKGVTRNYLTEYERDAIRPRVLGSFRDLLGATAKSPAMLFYLDNWLSTGAGVTRVRGALSQEPSAPQRRSTGLNENYARELLELHTLGVDGGYTQDDIVNVARAFTGWTMQPRQGSGFVFVARRHDRGEKKVLGQTLRAGGDISDGERVLDIVAAHPATARHIATRLAIRFVSDNPPPALIDRATARFIATKGNLREVTRTILTSPEFLDAGSYRAKVKTPLEFVASALRATGADIRNAQPLARTLRDMGMPLYFCQPPTGYDETAAAWVSAGALVSRMNFAVDLSKNAVRGVRVPLSEAQTLALQIGAPEFQRR